eukprot:2282632-Pleurochrysis_carterae.AAC.1
MNYAIAKAISSLRTSPDTTLAQPPPHSATMALPVAVARPIQPSDASTDVPSSASASVPDPDTPADAVPSAPATSARTHFQRSLGSFNLRSSQPSALLVTRRHQ